jgi:hypothetical protein
VSRDAEGGEMVQWTISSGERREHERAAANRRSWALGGHRVAAERSERGEDEKHALSMF